jgi:transposase-like protein
LRACKYRLTSQEEGGRSNRRRFSDEQKRATVQETEKPGGAVAEVCRRHGIANSLLFRWRVQFGLTAPKGATTANRGARRRRSEWGAGARCLAQSRSSAGRDDDRTGGRTACLCAGQQQSGRGEAAARRGGDITMIVVLAGVKVHLALDYADMRKGLDGVQRHELPRLASLSFVRKLRHAGIQRYSKAAQRVDPDV